MPEYFHGTSRTAAREIERGGLSRGSFVTTDFDLAASYALQHGADGRIVVLTGDVAPPVERAYDEEYIALQMRVLRVLRPAFRSVPEDYYELDNSISGRKYPALFARRNWR